MAVDDHGLEVLKKAGVDLSGNKTNYGIQVLFSTAMTENLDSADYISSVESPANTITYTFKQGGSSGTVLGQIQIIYTAEDDYTVERIS